MPKLSEQVGTGTNKGRLLFRRQQGQKDRLPVRRQSKAKVI